MSMKLKILDGVIERDLLVPDDFAPVFEAFNPALMISEIEGPIAFDVKLPVHGNAEALKQAHHIETADGDPLFNFHGYVDGALTIRGKLLVERSSFYGEGDGYECSLIATDFASQIEGKSLREVCQDTIVISELPNGVFQGMKDASSGSWPDYAVAFPTYRNHSHFDGNNDDFEDILNPWSQALQAYEVGGGLPVGADFYENKFTYAPTLYLLWVFNKICEYCGYALSGDLITDPDFKKISLLTNYSTERFLDGDMALLRRTTDVTIQNTYLPFDEIEEQTSTSVTTGGIPYTIDHQGLHKIRLELNVGIISNGSATVHFKTGGTTGEGFDAVITGNNQLHVIEETVDFSAAAVGTAIGVFVNSGGLNIEFLTNTRIRIVNVTETSAFTWKHELEAANLVPDMSVGEFIIAIRNYLNLKIDIDPVQEEMRLSYCESILDKSPLVITTGVSKEIPIEHLRRKSYRFELENEFTEIDQSKFIGEYDMIEDLPNALTGSIALVRSLGSYYVYEVDDVELTLVWNFLGIEQPYFEFGDGESSTVSIPAELVRVVEYERNTEEFLIPFIDEKGSSETLGMEDGKIRLVFYHGLVNGSDGAYPFASPFGISYGGAELTDFSLSMVDPDRGIYTTRYQRWSSVLQSTKRVVKRVVGLLNRELLMERPIWINHQLYICESVEYVEGREEVPQSLTLRRIPV